MGRVYLSLQHRETGGLNAKVTVRAWGPNLSHPCATRLVGCPSPQDQGLCDSHLSPGPPPQAELLYQQSPLTSKSTLSPSGILGGTKFGMKSLLQRGMESQGSPKQLGEVGDYVILEPP